MNNDKGRINFGVGLDNTQLRADIQNTTRMLRGVGSSAQMTGRQVDAAFRDAGSSIKTAFSGINSAILDVGKSMLGLSAIMAGGSFLKDLLDQTKEFSKQMRIVSTISQEVAEDMNGFKEQMLQMCEQIAVAPTTAAEALYQISSAGHTGAAGMQVLQVSAKSAVGGVTEVATAADAITTILNAYHLSADEAESISDKLFTTVRLGKTTMGELGHSISAVAPTAATFGVSIDEVLAMIAELTKQGVPTATAIRQINMAILAVTQSLGDGAFQTRTLLEAFKEVEKQSKGSENALKKDLGNVNALRAVLAATGENAEESAQMLDELKNSAGAAEAAFEKMNTSAGAEATKLKNHFLSEFQALGDNISSITGGISKKLNEAFEDGSMQRCLEVLVELVKLYGIYRAILIAVAAIQYANVIIGEVAAFISLAKAVKTAEEAQVLFNVAASSNPLGALIRLVLMAAAAFGIYKYATSAMTEEQDRYGNSATAAMKKVDDLRKAVNGLDKDSKGCKDAVNELNQVLSDHNIELITEADNRDTVNEKCERAIELIKAETVEIERLNKLKRSQSQYEGDLKTAYDNLYGRFDNVRYAGWNAGTSEIRDNASLVTDIVAQVVEQNLTEIADKTGDEYEEGVDKIFDQVKSRLKGIGFSDKAIEVFDRNAADDVRRYTDRVVEANDANNERNILIERNADAVREEATANMTYAEKLQYTRDQLSGCGADVEAFCDKLRELTRLYGQNEINFTVTFDTEVPEWMMSMDVAELKRLRDAFASFAAANPNGANVNGTQMSQQQMADRSMLYAAAYAKKTKTPEKRTPQRAPKNKDKGKDRAAREAEELAREQAQRERTIAEYGQQLAEAWRLAEFDIQQAHIDAMDEGVEKELALAQLNFRRAEFEVLKKRREMIEALADIETLRWQEKNPKAKDSEVMAYRNSLVDPYMFLDRGMAGAAMSDMANGNVDMLSRPLVDAAKLVEKGWEAAGDGIATVFSTDYDIAGADGTGHRILVTPILPDGSVLSPDELDAYVFDVLNGSSELLAADSKGIIIGIDLPEDAGETLHQLQELYYMGQHTPREGALTVNDLTGSEQTMLADYQRIAAEELARANRAALETMLADVLTYQQRREQVEREYADKRKQLYIDGDESMGLRQGVTQGNLDELNRQAEEAIAAVDEEFASREETYQAWCDEVANLTLTQLQTLLANVQDELGNLEKNENADSTQLAIARAKVATLEKAVKSAQAKNDVSPKARSIKEWEDLYKTLQECEREFEAIGDAVGGVAGVITSTAGQIATSSLQMINGIVQLVNMSKMGIEGTAKEGAKAISTMEKASVILTIISAAMQIAMTIINLFNSDEKKQKEIEALQERIDQLQWEVDNLEINRYTSVQKTLELVYSTLKATKAELLSGAQSWAQLESWSNKVGKNQLLLERSAAKLADYYSTLAYTADKALGADKYTEARSQLENIAQRQLLISQQIDDERSKKDSDSGAIQDYENKIAELGQEALELINELVEDIIGGSSNDIANELADAFIEAFQAGEDAAEAWGEKVDDIVADIMKRMLVSKFLEEPLGEVFNRYKDKWFPNGQASDNFLDVVIGSMNDFADDLNVVGEEFATIWENLPDGVKNAFTATADAREAGQGGIATASQDSVDELNARMTTIQGHTYEINATTKGLLVSTNAILQHVMNIDTNTASLKEKVENLETGVKSIRANIEDIAIKGVKLK